MEPTQLRVDKIGAILKAGIGSTAERVTTRRTGAAKAEGIITSQAHTSIVRKQLSVASFG
jgi:hypothetical protein